VSHSCQLFQTPLLTMSTEVYTLLIQWKTKMLDIYKSYRHFVPPTNWSQQNETFSIGQHYFFFYPSRLVTKNLTFYMLFYHNTLLKLLKIEDQIWLMQ
jgi:hypothetical protein